jgi:glycerol-3-phosphate acyltransferase PlsY
MNAIWMLLVTLGFYIYGSIPIAYIAVRRSTGDIILAKGSGNVGVANAFRVGGLAAGFTTVLGEVSKALLPLGVSFLFFEYDMMANVLFTGAALLGTNFSIFLRRRSGLGTTCVMYSLLVLSPFSLLGLLGMMGLGFVLSKKNGYVSGLAGYISLPFFLYIFNDSIELVFWGVYVALLFGLAFSAERDEYPHGFGYRKKNAQIPEVKDKGDSR